MTIALRLLATLVVGTISYVVLGYLAVAPLGAIYGWGGHPAMPSAPMPLYYTLYVGVLPVLCLAGAWKLTRWLEARWRGSRNGP
jgi:hypothetical protein